jgi:hypothetical protein
LALAHHSSKEFAALRSTLTSRPNQLKHEKQARRNIADAVLLLGKQYIARITDAIRSWNRACDFRYPNPAGRPFLTSGS